MNQNIDMNLDNRPLAERAADKVEELIRNDVFASGDKLPNEYELSEMLHVGRSTVRESIKILESRHVVKIRRGFGTYICNHVGIIADPLGLRFMNNPRKIALDLCQMRMMLEPSIARLAARNATDANIAEIQKLCDTVALLIEQGKNYGKQDRAFHTKIAGSSGNLIVSRVIPIICNGIESYVELTNSQHAGTAAATHQKIANAIQAHDEDGAFQAMEQHIKENYGTLLLLPDSF